MIEIGERRYYRWGDEPCGMVSVWTIDKNHVVKHDKEYMKEEDARKKGYIQECPYP